ncbi:major facilitator superfamily domain-containing protein [Microdochium trichocladiopsis]|uniref:Major facilitator superfamily domain-containing protein n=1 Tax=Microdochium trichocladiopsis TaxID=1682393 RepID=A0A9P9BQ57_9PEZI|nr:major facilitator superfamily domain-containing protein [Microdochium trichocladiopsis]KAH7029875.1 major facilitator superfamily domain-containing protein [Microdochium trichocladiopsis]
MPSSVQEKPAPAPADDKNEDEAEPDLKTEPDALAVDTVEAATEYSDAYFRKLLWRIDLCLLPVMWICYGTQQADKTSLSVQAVFGIREDTGLVGEQFNWLSTVFYLSYLVCEGPANWLMQRYNVGRFLAIVMFAWGIVVMCIAFAKNFAHLMILRTLQGALECTISPTFMLITGAWYTSREHAFRGVIWGTSNAGMNIITGLINYGIGLHAQTNPGGLAPWKGISFFLGALTMFDAVLVWFFLGTPREVRWLTEEQKRAAIARVVGNQTGSDRNKRSEFKWDQVWDTFRDPQTYFFFFVSIINALPNGATTTFSKLIWQSFGFTSLETLTKGSTPYYCLSIIWFLVGGYITLKKPNTRFIVMMSSLIPAFTGMFALAFLPSTVNIWVRWAMYMIQVFGVLPSLLVWTFLPSNVAGRTKKTVTSTILFIAYCVGNAIGAQMFVASDAPKYIRGITACGVLYVVEFCCMASWRFYYIWENRRRAKIIAERGISAEEAERLGKLNAEADMTDRENIFFKYQY